MLGLALSVLLLAVSACRTPLVDDVGFSYFAQPPTNDAWSRKIHGWQQREQEAPSPSPVAAEPPRVDPSKRGLLRAKYDAFLANRKHQLASDLAHWIQTQANDHYVPDGPVDHWATLEETFRTNGDDCDGLELLVFHALRDLGFRENEVFRAIVVRPADGQHHMVTLWFEDPNDPWVIDPTGAMTSGMPRMSEVPGWIPIKVFTERADYSVERGHVSHVHTAQR